MGNRPVIYEWPLSQKCMECLHGKFIMGAEGEFDNSNYLCMEGQDGNDGTNCSGFKSKASIKNVEVADPRINADDKFQCTLYITLHDGRVCDIDIESMMVTEHWLQGEE